ncbi:hypothetical protein EV360DRAFT_71757 [Lentinula raphanica]|nr:hypothetical protein EV360DRAFT_71757 [Lentinula raphanica]
MPIPFSLPPKELVSTDAILTTSTVYRKNITNYSSLFMVHLKSKIFIVFLAANDMASVLAIPVPSGSDVGGSHVPVSASGSSAGGSNAGVSGANGAGAVIGANAGHPGHPAQVQQANSQWITLEEPDCVPSKNNINSCPFAMEKAKVNELLALGYSADSTQMRMLTMTLDHIGTNEMCQLVWVPEVDMYLAKWRASRRKKERQQKHDEQESGLALSKGEEQSSRPASPKPGSS